MWTLLIFFGCGIVIGIIIKGQKKVIKISSKLSEFSVFLLLFWLGYLMGTNSHIIKNILSMGIDALILSIFSMIGSILLILPLEKFIK